MRGRLATALIAVLALAACDDEGVSLEVHRGETGATRVELYLVDGDCYIGDEPCPRQLKTPSSTSHIEGEIYTRKNPAPLAANVEGDGVAYFTLLPGDHDGVPRAIAVGFDGDTIVGGVALREFSTADPHRRIVALEPIADDQVTGDPSEGLRIETWYQASGAGCLAFERQHEGEVKREFIVPASDPDCDDFVEPLECDALWPDYATPVPTPGMQQFTCVAEVSDGISGHACLLGSGGCTDGTERADCTATHTPDGRRYCIPGALCLDAPSGCNGGEERCAFARMQNSENDPPKQTRLHCKVAVEPFNAASTRTCNGLPAVALVQGNREPLSASCTGASVGPVTDVGFGMFLATQNNLDVRVSPDCVLSMTFSEQFPIAATRYLDDHVVKIDLTNSYAVIIPLLIELVPVASTDCTTLGYQTTCELEGPDEGDPRDASFVACPRLPTP